MEFHTKVHPYIFNHILSKVFGYEVDSSGSEQGALEGFSQRQQSVQQSGPVV
jgi:hypothetical protein